MKGKFSKIDKIIFTIIFLILFFSGIFWLILCYLHISKYNNLASKFLMIHGICGLITIFIFGIIWTKHAKHKLQIKQKKNRQSGLIILILLSLISISSAGLYYIGYEELRNFISIFHWSLGIILVIAVIFHIMDF